jgi:hypothetical protein
MTMKERLGASLPNLYKPLFFYGLVQVLRLYINCCCLNRNPSFRLINVLYSVIIKFADPRPKNTVRGNRVNLTKGKRNLFELPRTGQAKFNLVRVSGVLMYSHTSIAASQ